MIKCGVRSNSLRGPLSCGPQICRPKQKSESAQARESPFLHQGWHIRGFPLAEGLFSKVRDIHKPRHIWGSRVSAPKGRTRDLSFQISHGSQVRNFNYFCFHFCQRSNHNDGEISRYYRSIEGVFLCVSNR